VLGFGLAVVGIAGEHSALPLGILSTTASLCAIASFVGLVIPVVRARMSGQHP
jgi:hypothetical protein